MSVYKLAEVITAHAWSPDGSMVAVCENEPDVIIYSNCQSPDVKQWKQAHVLRMHTMTVSGIDWSPVNNMIVTCSHDVNAFVWSFDQRANEWVAKVSILRIERAALQCRWSPDGMKFAVASASKVASICYFQQKQDWWVSKPTARGAHKSTVLDVAWHPSSQIFATACSDFKCRVFSGFIPEIDKPGVQTCFGDMSQTDKFQLLTEFEATGAWIEGCAWSPSGNGLAFVGHDATISFVSFQGGQPVCTTIKTGSLPFTRCLFLGESTVVAVGHGFYPEVYQASGNQWQSIGIVDSGKGSSGGGKKAKGKFGGALDMFSSKVKKGQDSGPSPGEGLKYLHENLITDINMRNGGFTTSSTDGSIILWDKSSIKKTVPAANI